MAAEATLAVRDTGAGPRTAAAITAGTGNASVDVKHLELADRDSVAKLAGAPVRHQTTSATSASRSACTKPSRAQAGDALRGRELQRSTPKR
ncbi:hypothetical protein AB0F91_33885 [Amycolatopsis sp. NPDC023774]|uniref:hypothetical protein n=1 Tax=Amycolatopsis sp. NPDC023774 TaxID=3155015 RepID=UPI0033D42685